jgi:hypothetical protein
MEQPKGWDVVLRTAPYPLQARPDGTVYIPFRTRRNAEKTAAEITQLVTAEVVPVYDDDPPPGTGECGPGVCTCGAHVTAGGTVIPAAASS